MEVPKITENDLELVSPFTLKENNNSLMMEIVQIKYNAFRNEIGEIPKTLVMSKEMAFQLEYEFFRIHSSVKIDSSLTLMRYLGMKIIKTEKPGIVEVY